jgi:hypothetical protein
MRPSPSTKRSSQFPCFTFLRVQLCTLDALLFQYECNAVRCCFFDHSRPHHVAHTARVHAAPLPRARAEPSYRFSEKGAKLAQKLGQLQPSLAAFPQACTGQLTSFWPTSYLPRFCPARRRGRRPGAAPLRVPGPLVRPGLLPQYHARPQFSNLTPIFIGLHRNAPLSPMERVPGYTIPMVPTHLAPMAPMNLVEQSRALLLPQYHARARTATRARLDGHRRVFFLGGVVFCMLFIQRGYTLLFLFIASKICEGSLSRDSFPLLSTNVTC